MVWLRVIFQTCSRSTYHNYPMSLSLSVAYEPQSVATAAVGQIGLKPYYFMGNSYKLATALPKTIAVGVKKFSIPAPPRSLNGTVQPDLQRWHDVNGMSR